MSRKETILQKALREGDVPTEESQRLQGFITTTECLLLSSSGMRGWKKAFLSDEDFRQVILERTDNELDIFFVSFGRQLSGDSDKPVEVMHQAEHGIAATHRIKALCQTADQFTEDSSFEEIVAHTDETAQIFCQDVTLDEVPVALQLRQIYSINTPPQDNAGEVNNKLEIFLQTFESNLRIGTTQPLNWSDGLFAVQCGVPGDCIDKLLIHNPDTHHFNNGRTFSFFCVGVFKLMDREVGVEERLKSIPIPNLEVSGRIARVLKRKEFYERIDEISEREDRGSVLREAANEVRNEFNSRKMSVEELTQRELYRQMCRLIRGGYYEAAADLQELDPEINLSDPNQIIQKFTGEIDWQSIQNLRADLLLDDSMLNKVGDRLDSMRFAEQRPCTMDDIIGIMYQVFDERG